jgi:hypothetical protein
VIEGIRVFPLQTKCSRQVRLPNRQLLGRILILPHLKLVRLAQVYRIIIQEIHSYYKIKALASGIKDPRPGAISFTQLAGSALNLNPHLHILFCDGVFSESGETFRFRNLATITDREVEKLLVEISSKVMKLLKKLGYLNHEGEMVNHPLSDVLFRDHESLAMATSSSIAGRIAFGPNAGKQVTRIGSGFGYYEEIPLQGESDFF